MKYSLQVVLSRRKLQLFYIGESSKSLKNRAKEHNSHVTSAVYKHSATNNHPWTNISHFKILDQDNKQAVREAIHIRINNPTLNCNTGRMYIPEIFNHLLGADRSTDESQQVADSDLSQGHTHLTIQGNRFFRSACLAN